MLMASSRKDRISIAQKTPWPETGDIWEMNGLGNVWEMNGLGDFWGDLVAALPAVATVAGQTYVAVAQADAMSQMQSRGIMPSAYQSGVPLYYSTPAGVTPNNPYSLPSGMALPPGVTPNYTAYIPPPQMLPSFLPQSLQTNPILLYGLLGGGALLLILMLKR